MGLHQVLPGDDALALVGVLAAPAVLRQNRRLGLLGLQEQRLHPVQGVHQQDPGAGADAADPDDLAGHLDQRELLEQAPPVGLPGAPVFRFGPVGNRGQVNYSAAKAGIIGATKALAVELANRNITVNCVAPGLIDTQMVKDAPNDLILDAIPMRRIGRPEDVAAAVSFLCSDDAAYITRQVLSVNGGMA